MRLPKNPDNWVCAHADEAINEALVAFAIYERRIDFTMPKSKQNDLFRPYLLARERAMDVARSTGWRLADAERLP